MDPGRLPGWTNQKQALDLRGATIAELQERVARIAESIKQEKAKGWVILGSAIAALFILGSDDKE